MIFIPLFTFVYRFLSDVFIAPSAEAGAYHRGGAGGDGDEPFRGGESAESYEDPYPGAESARARDRQSRGGSGGEAQHAVEQPQRKREHKSERRRKE